MRKLVIVAVAAVVAAMVMSCAHAKKAAPAPAPTPAPAAADPEPTTPPADRQQIIINNHAYFPGTMRVTANTEIIWSNKDSTPHTVTAQGMFDSGPIPPGGEFSHRFMKPGTFPYACTIHPDMHAEVVVQ